MCARHARHLSKAEGATGPIQSEDQCVDVIAIAVAQIHAHVGLRLVEGDAHGDIVAAYGRQAKIDRGVGRRLWTNGPLLYRERNDLSFVVLGKGNAVGCAVGSG